MTRTGDTTLITHEEFGRLRLRDFVDDPGQIAVLEDWEYMDDLWIGEAVGFTEFLRLDEEPGTLKALSIHFETLAPEVSGRLAAALGLPLRGGMDAAALLAALGDPAETLACGADRRSYRFHCGKGDVYDVFCTVEDEAGLTSAAVMAPTPRRLAPEPRGEREQEG